MTLEVHGQGAVYERLLRLARAVRLPHALLVSGARGSGKSTAARQLAQALLCEELNPDEPCGQCGACAKVESGSHPDVHVLTRPEDKRDIPVETVRELQATLERSAHEGRARVALIDPADSLNEQGQNALLKTLEEPNPDTFLILVAARPEALLETVRSRVQRLGIQPLPESAILEHLSRESLGENETRTWAATTACGSLGRARVLLSPEAREVQDLVVPFLEGADTLGAFQLAKAVLDGASGPAEKRARARLVLVMFGALHRGSLGPCLEGVENGVYPGASLDPWTAHSELLFEAEEDLELQIPPDQVLAGLFLRWRE